MKNEVIKNHIKGHKHIGKTNWSKIIERSAEVVVDKENPELVFKKIFNKPNKTKKS
ncbi:MAG: hypothetical protein L3J70_07510 [Gammaproteobacteria bacterium]|nr:hypothetical protein [Gammaproteobacteria bacterium]